LSSAEAAPSATTDEELNKLLDQIEEEIGKDMDLTQDLLDILNDEARCQCYKTFYIYNMIMFTIG
jgi:hypothetical protein